MFVHIEILLIIYRRLVYLLSVILNCMNVKIIISIYRKLFNKLEI